MASEESPVVGEAWGAADSDTQIEAETEGRWGAAEATGGKKENANTCW